MEAVSTLERGRALTVDDLEAMPDDGNRYELIDGVLVVSAAPRPVHQQALVGIVLALKQAAPGDLLVLPAPLDVELDRHTMVEPDVLVARRDAFNDKRLPGPPLLAVEVLSPSTRLTDLNTKFARYERAGIPSYWVVYPDEPRLVVWELQGERYVEVADVGPDETWTAALPFEVTIAPGALLA